MSGSLVVSRYEEDVSWVALSLQNPVPETVVVYNKGRSEVPDFGPRVAVRRVPNVGREGGTFLDYIIENHDCLPDRLWFSQGDPFEHSPSFLGLLEEEGSYAHRAFQSLSFRYKDNYIPHPSCLDLNTAFDMGGKRCSPYFIRDMQVAGHCRFVDDGI